MRRDVFQGIADPTRRQIIGLLASKNLSLNEIAKNFKISRPAISQQVKILMECGLIVINQQGRERYCEIRPEKFDEISEWMDQFKEIWENRFRSLDGLLKTMNSKQRKKRN